MTGPWTLGQVDQWLDEVEPIADERTLFDWLEIPPTASHEAIQRAYHQIARTRHPDQYRSRLRPEELDRLVRMYSRVTAAYAELRVPDRVIAYIRALRGGTATIPPGATPPHGTTVPPPNAPPTTAHPPTQPPRPRTASPAAQRIDPAHNMSSRALAFYRRAEGALRTGDRAAATLHLKMAIAADPQSSFLRAALAELQGKKA